MKMRAFLLDWRGWLGALCLALFLGGQAQAHGYVVRAIPADRSTLPRPPTRLQYWFSEDLEPRFSEITLRDQTGTVIASGSVDARNHALLALTVPPSLPDGAYIVELRPAFASDGHVIAEIRVFFIGEEVGGVAGQVADDRAIPLEALWRAALNLANFLFFGAATLYSLVLLPAWGSGRYRAGGLPPRVLRRLRACLVAAVALAFSANFIALLQQSMVFFAVDAAQVLAQNLWQVTLLGSRFGDVWTFRLVLLIFCAVLLFVSEYYRAVMPSLASGIWRGLPWLGALFIGLSLVTSHAAGSTLLPWLAITVDWLHALAVAFWLGGAMTLVLLLQPALAPYAAEQRQQALQAVLLRFSSFVTPLVLLVIVSGIYNALNFFISPADLATSYGRTLGIKLLLVAPLLLLGLWQHLSLRPARAAGRPRPLRARIARAAGLPRPLRARIARAAGRLAALRLEVALMFISLCAVAWLSATPIPEPQSLETALEAPQATQTQGAFTITSAIIPGAPGVNTYDTALARAAAPISDAKVYLQLVNPERGLRSRWQLAEQVEDGLYVAAGDEVSIAGQWWTLIDVIEANGEQRRAAFAWESSEAAAIQPLRPPQPIHLLTLLALGAALALLVYPRARRLFAALNLTAASALLALAGVGGRWRHYAGRRALNRRATAPVRPHFESAADCRQYCAADG